MKVLYIIDSLVPAGAERSLAAMAPLLVQRGVDLDVAFLKDEPGLQPEISAAGARLFSLAGGGGRAGRTLRCRRLVANQRPDLVHTTLFESDLAGRTAARICGVPAVTSLVGINYGPEQRAVAHISRSRLRLAQLADIATARFAVRFHANSEHVARTMSPRLRIPLDRMEVIPRGRDPRALGVRDQARRERARRHLGVEPKDRLVLAAARHEHPKGLDVLLRAVPRVLAEDPDTLFAIAGRQGSQTQLLHSVVADLGISSAVTFLGPRDDLAELMCAADVFVLPSRWEGLPGTAIEAMALEAPIVATALPPIRELIDTDSAMLVPVEDPWGLSLAILQVLESPDAARERADAGRRRFLEHFTLDRIVEEMLSFYEAALSRR